MMDFSGRPLVQCSGYCYESQGERVTSGLLQKKLSPTKSLLADLPLITHWHYVSSVMRCTLWRLTCKGKLISEIKSILLNYVKNEYRRYIISAQWTQSRILLSTMVSMDMVGQRACFCAEQLWHNRQQRKEIQNEKLHLTNRSYIQQRKLPLSEEYSLSKIIVNCNVDTIPHLLQCCIYFHHAATVIKLLNACILDYK